MIFKGKSKSLALGCFIALVLVLGCIVPLNANAITDIDKNLELQKKNLNETTTNIVNVENQINENMKTIEYLNTILGYADSKEYKNILEKLKTSQDAELNEILKDLPAGCNATTLTDTFNEAQSNYSLVNALGADTINLTNLKKVADESLAKARRELQLYSDYSAKLKGQKKLETIYDDYKFQEDNKKETNVEQYISKTDKVKIKKKELESKTPTDTDYTTLEELIKTLDTEIHDLETNHTVVQKYKQANANTSSFEVEVVGKLPSMNNAVKSINETLSTLNGTKSGYEATKTSILKDIANLTARRTSLKELYSSIEKVMTGMTAKNPFEVVQIFAKSYVATDTPLDKKKKICDSITSWAKGSSFEMKDFPVKENTTNIDKVDLMIGCREEFVTAKKHIEVGLLNATIIKVAFSLVAEDTQQAIEFAKLLLAPTSVFTPDVAKQHLALQIISGTSGSSLQIAGTKFCLGCLVDDIEKGIALGDLLQSYGTESLFTSALNANIVFPPLQDYICNVNTTAADCLNKVVNFLKGVTVKQSVFEQLIFSIFAVDPTAGNATELALNNALGLLQSSYQADATKVDFFVKNTWTDPKLKSPCAAKCEFKKLMLNVKLRKLYSPSAAVDDFKDAYLSFDHQRDNVILGGFKTLPIDDEIANDLFVAVSQMKIVGNYAELLPTNGKVGFMFFPLVQKLNETGLLKVKFEDEKCIVTYKGTDYAADVNTNYPALAYILTHYQNLPFLVKVLENSVARLNDYIVILGKYDAKDRSSFFLNRTNALEQTLTVGTNVVQLSKLDGAALKIFRENAPKLTDDQMKSLKDSLTGLTKNISAEYIVADLGKFSLVSTGYDKVLKPYPSVANDEFITSLAVHFDNTTDSVTIGGTKFNIFAKTANVSDVFPLLCNILSHLKFNLSQLLSSQKVAKYEPVVQFLFKGHHGDSLNQIVEYTAVLFRTAVFDKEGMKGVVELLNKTMQSLPSYKEGYSVVLPDALASTEKDQIWDGELTIAGPGETVAKVSLNSYTSATDVVFQSKNVANSASVVSVSSFTIVLSLMSTVAYFYV